MIRSISRAVLLLLLSLVPWTVQGREGDAISSEAQSAISQGLEAAKSQKWDVAIEHFEAARKASPNSPQVLFNLALAHDKTGGHELLSMAWYHAYLGVAPRAPNAPAVRTRLQELEKKIQGTALELAASAWAATEKLPQEAHPQWKIPKIVGIQALAGDPAVAMGTVTSLKSGDYASCFEEMAKAQAQRGDFAAAKDAVARIANPNSTSHEFACVAIGEAMARRGHFDEAMDFARTFADGQKSRSGDIHGKIVDKLVEGVAKLARTHRDFAENAEARATLGKAELFAGALNTPTRLRRLIWIADDYTRVDGKEDAARILSQVLSEMEEYKKKDADSIWLYSSLVKALSDADLTTEARDTAARVLDEELKATADVFRRHASPLHDLIGGVPHVTEDFPQARKVARRMWAEVRKLPQAKQPLDTGTRIYDLTPAGEALLLVGDLEGGLEVLDVLGERKTANDAFSYDGFVQSCVDAHLKAGKTTKAAQLIPKIHEPIYRNLKYRQLAAQHAKSHEWSKALQTVEKIHDDPARASALAEVAGEYGLAGEWGKAAQLAAKIIPPRQQAIAWENIADARLKRGQADEAKAALEKVLTLAPKVTDLQGRILTWKDSVRIYVGEKSFDGYFEGNGDFAAAREMVARIPDDGIRRECEVEIAWKEAEKTRGPGLGMARANHSADLRFHYQMFEWEYLAENELKEKWAVNLGAYLDSLRPRKSDEVVDGMVKAARGMLDAITKMHDIEMKYAAVNESHEG